MARNLSIGTRCIKDSEGEKKGKKGGGGNCLKMHKKCYNLHTSKELVFPVCLSASCLQADWCLQGTSPNSYEHLSCRQLQINSRAIFSCWISWNLLWPLRIMVYFIEPLSRNSWRAKRDFLLTTKFKTVVRGARGHPTGNMISHFIPWPMNYSFLVSKLSVCNKAPNTFDSTTCQPAARLRRWLLNWYPVIQRQRETHCERYWGE